LSADRGVYLSSDNGTAWTPVNKFTDYPVFSFAIGPNEMGAINTFAGGNGVFLSTDNGTSWTSAGLTNTRVFSLTVMGSCLYAGTEDHGVFLSTNVGTSWTAVNEGLPRSGGDTTRYASIDAFALSGQHLFVGTRGGVFLSTNDGANWTRIFDGLPRDERGNYWIRDVAVIGSSVFVGTDCGVFLSTDNGTSWSTADSGLPPEGGVDLFAVSGANLFAGNESGVFLSTDCGKSWTAVNSGLPQKTPISAFAASGNILFAGTEGNGVWRRALSELITAVEGSSEVPAKFILEQNYPNPFNPTTTIRYALPEKVHVTLTVFNTLGQRVATLVQGEVEAGFHEAVFDASGLASGVYLYRLTAGSFVETHKLVLAR
jgi:photosystem II stability/assembly factor-like uncharacterized protein